jgi:hypothetical protein
MLTQSTPEAQEALLAAIANISGHASVIVSFTKVGEVKLYPNEDTTL